MTEQTNPQDTRPSVKPLQQGNTVIFAVVLPEVPSLEARYAKLAESYLEMAGHWFDFYDDEVDIPSTLQDVLRSLDVRKYFDADHPFILALDKAIADRDRIDEMMYGYTHLLQSMERDETLNPEPSNVVELFDDKSKE